MRIIKIIALFLTHVVYFGPVMLFGLVGITIALFTHKVLRFEVGYDITKSKFGRFLTKPMEWVEDKCLDAIIK